MKKRGQAKPPSTTRNVSLARPADQEDVIEVFDDLDSHDKVKKAKGAKQPPSEATKAHRKPPSKKQARDGGEQTAKGQEKPVKSEKPQGKRVKHASLDEGDEDAQIVKVKKGRAGDVSRGKQKHVLEEDANDGEESDQDPLPKKKRKIQVVPNGPAASFTWDKLNMGDGGLDIPTELSPIKDSEVPKTVPGRLGTARGLGPFGRR
ncbi:hypothetical protein JAAARDRAFT_128195 [Jaapia argillacea MUCL 33604]|uniref:Uncharacterized protein n=1 Tax=Jaapia argillacea MUCL 33604 TaxID=933084 RepID=A0A067Q9G8_9AGAM|nr:hypothetical protein JAAARDRAFT_128195 [Jaapia argillacea MUCL 33604]